MDMKEQISRIADIKEQFEKEPVKVIEKITGLDLPDDMVMKIIEGVKAKLTVDSVARVADTIKGIFK